MGRLLVILLVGWVACGFVRGDEGKSNAGIPWMGVRLGFLPEPISAHLKGVPRGFGLLVEGLDEGGPAELAGVRVHDVIWKFDDQLVANKGQLCRLLKHKGVEGEVLLSVSRSGETKELKVRLKQRPQAGPDFMAAAIEPVTSPVPFVDRVVNLRNWTAYQRHGSKTISVSRKPTGFEYTIAQGEELERGQLEGLEAEEWEAPVSSDELAKITILARALLSKERTEARSPTRPRVRRVPVSEAQNEISE
ncbi:MAG: PDZ domain-containing protein [Verrucomicrobiota bacterium]